MPRKPLLVLAIGVGVLAQGNDAPAWEAQTTSAGIVEQAALSSTLHQHLSEQLGQRGGMFEPMRIPRADAPALYEVLDKLSPSDGHVPDANGRQLALAWLAAGAALADTPAEHAVNHFYDPITKKGAKLSGGVRSIQRKLTSIALRERLVSGGVSAPEWLTSVENPMSVDAFHAQLRKAVSSRTPAERERHAAAALLAAGAIVHVITDLASPAHVRGDLESFFDRVSSDGTDVGSRFERLAAVAYGRLGVKRPGDAVLKSKLADFISNSDGDGLADIVSKGYFSRHTLPLSITVKRGESSSSVAEKIRGALIRPQPAPVGPFKLEGARGDDGARLESTTGVCLAHYRLEGTKLSFSIPDRCALEQIAELLPLAASYGAGVLEFLFRGSLEVAGAGSMLSVKTGVGVTSGALTAYWDDELGVRTQYAKLDAAGPGKAGAALGQIAAPPETAKAIAVVFEGVDANGEPLTAATYTVWPIAKKK